MADEPLTDARLAEIKAAIEQGSESTDYYVGGLCDASAAQELLRGVERLRTENAAMRAALEKVDDLACDWSLFLATEDSHREGNNVPGQTREEIILIARKALGKEI